MGGHKSYTLLVWFPEDVIPFSTDEQTQIISLLPYFYKVRMKIN